MARSGFNISYNLSVILSDIDDLLNALHVEDFARDKQVFEVSVCPEAIGNNNPSNSMLLPPQNLLRPRRAEETGSLCSILNISGSSRGVRLSALTFIVSSMVLSPIRLVYFIGHECLTRSLHVACLSIEGQKLRESQCEVYIAKCRWMIQKNRIVRGVSRCKEKQRKIIKCRAP